MANKLRGEHPFTQAGEGVVIKLTASDLMEIKSKFGEDWFVDAWNFCRNMDATYIFHCLKIGAKKDGKPFLTDADIDNLECGMSVVADAVLDAIYVAVYRKTFAEQMEVVAAELEKAAGEDEPKNAPSPDVLSNSSETKPSGQD